MRRILILGGTRDAVVLAGLLHDAGMAVTTSLAGVTGAPGMPKGGVRQGGFGGVDGLAAEARAFDLIADAAHPFAARISAHAVEAAERCGLPIMRLERPAWMPAPGDQWITVGSIADAAREPPEGARIFLTTGRKDLAPFFERTGLSGVVRMIEDPGHPFPDRWTLLRGRPPFTVAQETDVIGKFAITHLVTKNSGGPLTQAKLIAARERKLPVIMISRPPKPAVETHAEPEGMARAIRELLAA